MFGLETDAMTFILGALIFFVSIGINSLVIKFVAKKLNFKKPEYKLALIVAVASSIAGAALSGLASLSQLGLDLYTVISTFVLPIINLLIGIALIRFIYKEDWKNSAKAGILWWIISMIIGLIISAIIVALALYSMGVFSSTTSGITMQAIPCINCFGSFAYVNHNYNGSHLALELRNGPEDLYDLACDPLYDCFINTTYVEQNENFIVYIHNTNSGSVQTALLECKKGTDLNSARYSQIIDAKFFK